jgi:hypothetical protein
VWYGDGTNQFREIQPSNNAARTFSELSSFLCQLFKVEAFKGSPLVFYPLVNLVESPAFTFGGIK